MIIEKDNRLWIGIMICGLATSVGPAIGGFLLGVGIFLISIILYFLEFLFVFPDYFLADYRLDNINLNKFFGLLIVPFFTALGGYIFGIIPAFFSSLFTAIHSVIYGKISLWICWVHTLWVMCVYAAIFFSTSKWSVTFNSVLLFLVLCGCGLGASYFLLKWLPGVLYELRIIKSRSGVTP